MNRSRLISCTALVLALIAQNSFAGGVALSSTRVIYDGSRKEASLTVNNKSTTDEFLI
ncbi:fimbria/pilus periplasmic chaperone, partial [Salmonella enterica]